MTLPFDLLRRWPDIEARDLPAVDAADRLILDESAGARRGLTAEDIVVVGDGYGALALGAAVELTDAGTPSDRAGRGIRVHQDALTGERALSANAERVGLTGSVASLPLDAELLRGARVVLLRLPRSLDALRDIAGLIAAHAAPEVRVFAGGRIKHMTTAMNDVLRDHFETVDVTHARQKSRVLIARGPHSGQDPVPRRKTVDGIDVVAYGGVFAGASIDVGTRFLLQHLPADLPDGTLAVDMACGTGVVATALALTYPGIRVYASDQSATAVASARATADANGVGDRIEVVRDDALSLLDDGAASFVALNPPFHVGGAIHEGAAPRLFGDAARALRPGGELLTVWNSTLLYRPALDRLVGPTRQVARNTKFTLAASTRRG